MVPILTEPKVVTRNAFAVAGPRESYLFDQTTEIPAQWSRFSHHFGKIPGEVRGGYYGVSIGSADPGKFDYLTGAEISGTPQLPTGFDLLHIPARRYAVFEHLGHISEIKNSIRHVMNEWFAVSGHRAAAAQPGEVVFFERYTEAYDPHAGRGGTELWFPLADVS